MMPRKKKAGGYIWNQDVAKARSIMRKQRELIAAHLDGKIDEDLLLTAILTINAQADDQLETMLHRDYE